MNAQVAANWGFPTEVCSLSGIFERALRGS